MGDSSVDPGQQKAEKVQEDVRCLTLLLSRMVHGKKVSVVSFVPDKYPSGINVFHIYVSVAFAWEHKKHLWKIEDSRYDASSYSS